MKGISVWMFSKVVMLIFLIMVFGILVSFSNLASSKSAADSAGALAFQLREALRVVDQSALLSSQFTVPLPEKLPEKTASTQGVSPSKFKHYAVYIDSRDSGADKINSVSIALGDYIPSKTPSFYSAASSFISSRPLNDFFVSSADYKFVRATKNDAGEFFVCACNATSLCNPPGSSTYGGPSYCVKS